ncbi:MAG: hypothetical protein R2752_09150 [Vicinamibacterales bacterium]
MTLAEACAAVGTALDGDFRARIVAECAAAGSLRRALARLRTAMRAHDWRAGRDRVDLGPMVASFDARTRAEGFNAIRDWDGRTGRFSAETIPVDVLDLLASRRGGDPIDEVALAILVDYYFLHLLALLSLRAWDEGDANANLDVLTGLVTRLQGPGGSGQRFLDDGETLLILATAHYEPEEHGYVLLLDRVRALDHTHRVSAAVGHAAGMGCHLRYGWEATYGRSLAAMRQDNVADYPWVAWAVATVMAEFARLTEAGETGPVRDRIAEALLQALSPDAGAFVRDAPGATSALDVDRRAFLDGFRAHGHALAEAAEPFRPRAESYSPFSLFYNFSNNVVKGATVDALIWGEAATVSLNDLFTALPPGDPRLPAKRALATRLMDHALRHPDIVRGRPMPAIVYDPRLGRQMFSAAIRDIRAAIDAS